ncbi:MAG: M20/M25/M40 family metallo-hydrolase [Parvibaculaceae bacterium]
MPVLDAALFDQEAMLRGLVEWVSIESPTYEPEAVNRMISTVARELSTMGADIQTIAGRDGFGDAVLARFKGEVDGPGILVLAHLDTVHPIGTVDRSLPLRRDGDRYYGPGIFDMKGGTYIAVEALRQVLRAYGSTALSVTFLLIPDEEIGSPTTRSLIESMARSSKYVLVPEPAQDRGRLVSGRWAFARFVLRARGRPAHAGANTRTGLSAIREMAEQIIRIEEMSRPDDDVTYSVGKIAGGTFVNVVPMECSAEVLAIAPTGAYLKQVRDNMLALRPTREGVEFSVTEGPVRPLFECRDGTLRLCELAQRLAREVGFEVEHGSVGGGSDGNFTGALGIPTLDGLGLCGEGFHTHREYILVSSLVPRARVFGGLLSELK